MKLLGNQNGYRRRNHPTRSLCAVLAFAGDQVRPIRICVFAAQGEQAFQNLRRALTAAGSSLDNVMPVTIFGTDMDQFNHVVELRRRHFSAPYPADSIVEIKGLYTPEAMIEIEAIALA